MDDNAFAALRVAATLVHALPGLRGRVRLGGRTLCDVTWDDMPTSPMVVSPCGFRTAIAKAHRQRQAGEEVRFLHLSADANPAVDIGVPVLGRTYRGGIYAVPLGDRFLCAFATTLNPDVCHEELEDLVGGLEPPDGMWGLGIRGDSGTQITLLHTELACDMAGPDIDCAIELLHQVLARVTARELVDSVSALV